MTLTAVSGVDRGDAGVGSAVLNRGLLVGGALGIAVLGTVFANAITEQSAELAAAATGAPTPEQIQQNALVAQTFGTSAAFLVATWMMAAVTVVILVGLSIRHEDLATDVTPGAPPSTPDEGAVPVIPAPAEASDSPPADAGKTARSTEGDGPGARS